MFAFRKSWLVLEILNQSDDTIMYIEGSRMSEAQTSGTKPKKMVNRKIAFALGLVCIVLIAFIAYFTVTGISAQNSYTSLQNQNRQLQAWLDGNETLLNQIQADNADLTKQIAEQNNTISQLESNITDLQNRIAIANATIASLEASLTDLIDRSILISTVKIASVTKDEMWYSTFHLFSFTVNVADNGMDTVNDLTVVIRLYHDWMNISWPVTKYTNEVQGYLFAGNILQFGAIPAGGNETQSITWLGVDDRCQGVEVPINYAVATVFLGNITLDKKTLQFNSSLEQTWVFP